MCRRTGFLDSLGPANSTISEGYRVLRSDEWIERVVAAPLKEYVQADGRIRRWASIPEMENRYLRVILLSDGETVHNAFFDRRFQP